MELTEIRSRTRVAIRVLLLNLKLVIIVAGFHISLVQKLRTVSLERT